MQRSVFFVALSLGTIFFAASSEAGRLLAVTAGCSVLTWLVLLSVGKNSAFVLYPSGYGFVFAALYGLSQGWPFGGYFTAGLLLAGLAAAGSMIARAMLAPADDDDEFADRDGDEARDDGRSTRL